MIDFEPKIIGFLCNWCSYAGADLTGISRIQYPTNLRVIRVMCSGRIEPSLPLELLAEGADGVMISGCHIGDCHYIDGNVYAKRKFNLLERLVEKTGMRKERVILEWVSASEGKKFAEVISEFIEMIKRLGPVDITSKPKQLLNLTAARAAAEDFQLRALVSKEEKLLVKGNVYGEFMTQEQFDILIDKSIDTEFNRNKIRLLLSEKPRSVKELAKEIGIDTKDTLEHVVALRSNGLIDIHEMKENTPFYRIMDMA
jgi:F420-non-reducing hydrogenase iron-sulfur subunit